MTPSESVIRIRDVSKWYGEILGLNRVSLDVARGITSLVGPNGSGKSTLLNLIAGLLRASKGSIEVLGVPPSDPEALHRLLGYCTQHDAFQAGFTGEQFLAGLLRTHGIVPDDARALALSALERVGLAEARQRQIAAYSKGMRQRLKLALAMAHAPRVLLLDEPLNGLDPLGRVEMIALFREMAAAGTTIVLSSHVLHEVDALSDGVVMLHQGYVVAEGVIREVREEIRDRPMRVHVSCRSPARLAARAFAEIDIVGARTEGRSLIVETYDTLALSRLVARAATEDDMEIEGIDLVDENVQAVYEYLIRTDEMRS